MSAAQTTYKVNDFAKDLGQTPKVLGDILQKYLGVEKLTQRKLEDAEVNIIFEVLTREHAVDDLDAAFVLVSERFEAHVVPEEAPASEPVKEAPAKEPAAPAKEAPKAAEPAKEAPKAAQKPAATPAPKPASQPAQSQKLPQARPKQQTITLAPKPFEQGQAAVSAAPQNSPQQRHFVDTRTTTVDTAKYDERLDALVPERAKHFADASQNKERIKTAANRRQPSFGNKRRQEEQDKLRKLQQQVQKTVQLRVLIPDEISVGELAVRLKKSGADVVKKLMKMGIMASVSQVIDFDTASLVAFEFDAKVEKEVILTIEQRLINTAEDKSEDLESRDPIVVVMGHVDHGKTSLLDAIRKENVVSSEAGGITQHIGAYQVSLGERQITFLDTPGHAAFTSMRARGASVTDVAILVVAADDGIMPQTIEAINHAKAANVPLIVAVNKMDKEGANPDRVTQQLTEHGLVAEAWGGDTIICPISAKKGDGIDKLLEMVILTADICELKANPNRLASGSVIEAKLDKGRGPVATLLVQNGTLKSGDILIAGQSVGRVRAMTNDRGEKVEFAGPSMPVEVIGLAEVPEAGDQFNSVENERMARELVDERKQEAKDERNQQINKVTLDNLFTHIRAGEVKDFNIIIKADVQGSVEAIRASLEKLSNEEVRVRCIHGGVGAISESDVMLASTSNAIIIGFNVRPSIAATQSAMQSAVDVRLYRVIYDAIEEVESAMKGMLAPKFREVVLGTAEIRQTYKVSGLGTIAGCYVINGKIVRNAKIRVVRDGIVIHEGDLASLKRFKDDVKEVADGYECGMHVEKFNDIKEGDHLEAFIIEEYRD